MTGKSIGAAAIGVAALSLLAAWRPLGPLRTRSLEARVEQTIAGREIFAAPDEVLTLLRDRRVAIEIFDLRDEAAFNRFHLADARRLDPRHLDAVRALPPTTVKLLVSDDEPSALAVYRDLVLGGQTGVYVLDGGAAAWLAAYGPRACRHAGGCGRAALGDRHPASLPDPEAVTVGAFVPRVKLATKGKKAGGGCGG
jgi:rhodanese-related sulfurtransferase